MTTRKKVWLTAAVLYVILNGGGAVYAALRGEGMHAATHVALLLVGVIGYGVWSVASRSRERALKGGGASDEQLRYLQQSVDAVALEVERLGEAQRFSEKLRTGRAESPVKGPPKES
jgi:hypothetical protein